MEEKIIWDEAYFLNKNKSKSYKEQVIRRDSIVFKFLKEHDLILIDPFIDGKLKQNLMVRVKDLSEDGLKFLSMYHEKKPIALKWYDYIDKGGKEDNISILEKGLKSIREKK